MTENKHNNDNIRPSFYKKAAVVLFWLCIWQAAAKLIDNDILLVGPLRAGVVFLHNLITADFWLVTANSFARIGLGLLTALIIGFLLGTAAYLNDFAKSLIEPLIAALKAIPVVSFVVLLLIWFGSARLSFCVSFLVALPNIYVNTVAGLESVDKELLEMAEVFHIGALKKIFFIYRPAFMPYLVSCLKISVGMGFKSGVAAEIIGLPAYSAGERLYMSKIYLDTAGLFSWTLTIILLSFVFEKAALFIVNKLTNYNPINIIKNNCFLSGKKSQNSGYINEYRGIKNTKNVENVADIDTVDIELKNICKSYGEQKVLNGFSYTFKGGGRYCLNAPSGGGKTTLLRCINRLEEPDAGEINGRYAKRIGMVFQEDRLCGDYDTITNVMLCADASLTKEDIYNEALRLLPENCLDKPVNTLSGGMKRRCAILRAMLCCCDIVIMDEPFNGLDEENRKKAAAYILEKLRGKTLIITSHRDEDALLIGAVKAVL